MISLKVPYYEPGRIAEIHEKNNKYIVNRYDTDGKPSKVFYINKSQKNIKDLLTNYYDDLKEYLNRNSEKYNSSKENIYNKISYMENFKNIKLLFAFLAITPILGAIIDSNSIMFIGLGLELIFIPAFVVLDRYSKLYKTEEEKNKFAKEYANYNKSLELYDKTKKKTITPTKYSGLTKTPRDPKENISIKKKEKLPIGSTN